MSNINQFVVDQLTPRNQTGQSNQTYELNKSSVSPVRHVGRDARGYPIEDTIPTVKWAWFLKADGCINKVPLRTGSVTSNHADAIAYENETIYDQIMGNAIPANLCPYSNKYQHIIGGPFVTPPPGESDCGGSEKEGGCIHLQKLGELRRAEVLRLYNLQMEQFVSRQDEEFKRMRAEIVQGVGAAVGDALAKNTPAAARTQRLRDGKSDE